MIVRNSKWDFKCFTVRSVRTMLYIHSPVVETIDGIPSLSISCSLPKTDGGFAIPMGTARCPPIAIIALLSQPKCVLCSMVVEARYRRKEHRDDLCNRKFELVRISCKFSRYVRPSAIDRSAPLVHPLLSQCDLHRLIVRQNLLIRRVGR